MDQIEQLEPQRLWHFFSEICKVPRPSKHEEKIRAYLVNFGTERQLETLTDQAGNVLIRKSATQGYETAPSLLLQAHMDMVCEKNADVEHNFFTDPIEPYIDGDWVKAKGTTLGADDGMGVAAMMAILDAKDIEHGPVECLFTFDEETGLTGAKALGKGLIKSKYLVNLDSEDDGIFCIGCAGGIDTTATFHYHTEATQKNSDFLTIKIGGLMGGHSGSDIDKNRANAVQLLGQILHQISSKVDFQLTHIDGGNLRNAIAREAQATLCVPSHMVSAVNDTVNNKKNIWQEQYPAEKALKITVSKAQCGDTAIENAIAKKLIAALIVCPHGVMGMSQDIEGLVETSTNLASVKMQAGDTIVVTTSQRSSINSRKQDIATKVEQTFALAGAEVTHGDGYPGWKPNMKSKIKDVLVDSYKSLFGVTPQVGAIHAGLECGLFLEKYPYLDMISCGPTLIGVHSPDERAQISTVKKFWDMLLDVLKRMKNI